MNIKDLLHFKKKKKKSPSGMVLFLLGMILIASSAYLLFSFQLFTPKAEEILPKENILVFADFNSASCSELLTEKAPTFCEQRNRSLTSYFGEIPERFLSFSDRSALAIYNAPFDSEKESYVTALFRLTDTTLAEEFIKNLPGSDTAIELQDEDEKIFIFSEPKERYLFFWKGWLFMTTDENLLSQLREIKNQTLSPLAQDADFQKIKSSFASSNTHFIYAQTKKYKEYLPVFLYPLADYFPIMGFTITEKNNALHLSFSALNEHKIFLPEPQRKGFESLISSLPQDNILFVSAFSGFRQQFEEAFSFLEETDPAYSLYAQGRLRAIIADALRMNISLENDILPLLENNTLIALYTAEKQAEESEEKREDNNMAKETEMDEEDVSSFEEAEEVISLDSEDEKTEYDALIVMQVGDEDFAEKKKEKFIQGMNNAVASFIPRILTHELADGSTITEVAACDDCVTTEEKEIDGVVLTLFAAQNETGEEKSLLFGQKDDLLMIAEKEEHLIAYIKNMKSSEKENKSYFSSVLDIDDKSEIIVMTPEMMSFSSKEYALDFSDFSKIFLYREVENENLWQVEIELQF